MDTSIFKPYQVILQFYPPEESGRYMGGVPADTGLIEGWLKSLEKRGELLPDEDIVDELSAAGERQATIVESEAQTLRVTTTFYRDVTSLDADGRPEIYIPSHIIKGVMKEAGRGLLLGDPSRKLRGVITDLQLRTVVEPRKIRLGKYAADGVEEFGSRVRTPQGDRSILRRKEWLDLSHTPVTFTLGVVRGSRLANTKLMQQIWEWAGERGMGSGRAADEGRFIAQVVDLDMADGHKADASLTAAEAK